MTLSSYITANVQRPSITLRLAGRRVRGVARASTAWTFGAGIGGGTVELINPPTTPRVGMAITWTWGYSGVEAPGFTGTVSRILRRSYPNTWTLEVQDALAPAARRSGAIATVPLNTITAQAAINYIAETYAGNPPKDIPAISLTPGGSAWTLGTLTPVSWSNSSALAAMQAIAGTAGYWLYADPGGTVRARQMERRPSSSPFRTFQRGVNLFVEGAPEREQNASTVKNRITVRGANTGIGGAQLFDTWEASHAVWPGETHTTEFDLPLLEDIDDVTAVAQRLVSLYNREPNVVTATITADPRLFVGVTVAIQDSALGFSSPTNYFIYGIETSFDGQTGAFTQRLTLDGGLGPDGYTTIPPPVAVVTPTAYRENLNGDEVVEVYVNGAGSYSQSQGEIVSWAWTTATTQAVLSPTLPAGSSSPHESPVWVFVYPASAGTADITLTVTDTTSKTGTLTLTVDLSAALPTSPLAIAFGSAWEYTPDAGTTWNEITTGDTIAVPPYGSGWIDTQTAADVQTVGLLATRATGGTGVRASSDALATSTDRASLGAAITMLWQNTAKPLRTWAAVGDTVYRSIDGGVTFTAMAKPASGTNITWIIEDPSVDNSVFAAAGNVLYNATDPTSGWATLFTAPSGSTIRQFVRSLDGATTWVCLTGTFTGSPLQRVEGGIGVTFPVVSPVVSQIRTVGLLESNPITLYAVDSDRRIWQVNGNTGGSVVALANSTLPTGATAMHALVDPSIALPLAYIADFDSIAAGTGAVRKLYPTIDRLYAYRVGATGRQAHFVGLGQGGAPIQQDLLIATSGLSPGGVWLWTRAAAAWVLKNSGLPSGWNWSMLDVNAFNTSLWILHGLSSGSTIQKSGTTLIDSGTGLSPFWITTDAGDTWNAVTITSATFPAGTGAGTFQFGRASPAWWFGGGGGSSGVLCRGTGTTGTQTATLGTAAALAGSGISEDVLFAVSPGNLVVYVPDGASSSTTPGGSAPGSGWQQFASADDTRLIVARSNGLHTSADYRTAQPINTGLTAQNVAFSGGRFWVRDTDFIKEAIDPFGTPSLGDAVAAGSGTANLVAANQQRGTTTAALAAYTTTSAFICDGTRFEVILFPGGVADTNVGAMATIARAGG